MTKVCKNPDCNLYPSYGPSPHECFWRKPGGFNNELGTSTIKPVSEWPKNFLVEVDGVTKTDLHHALNYGSCGVTLCPECFCGGIDKFKSEHLLDVQTFSQLLIQNNLM